MSDDRVLRRPASPSIAVVGLYSWTADRNAYLHFIEQQIAERDPANFAERTKDILRRLRPHADLRPFTEEARREVEARFASFHLECRAGFWNSVNLVKNASTKAATRR